MPGLAGIYVKKEVDFNLEELNSKMVKKITYENWYKINNIVDKKIACGRASLGVLDPEPQPIFNEDKTLWIMMEGEIYDYDDLKNELIKKGHSFKFNNDPEFILHLYEEYSKNFGRELKNLNGIFSAIIYNQTSNCLIIFNDRYGFKPLYLCDRGNYLLFSSEIKAILEDKTFKRVIDFEAMVEFFSFGYLLGDKTLIRDINLLPPASMLICSERGVKINQYWDWREIKKIKTIDEEKIIDNLGQLWLQAVKRRMRGPAKKGLLLSGGLDSRAIAAAVSYQNYLLETMTFGIAGCLDEQIAKKVCRILGIKHYFAELTPEKWLTDLDKLIYITEGFANVIHQHINYDVIELMKKHFDINLSGFLGDATVGGGYLINKMINLKNIDLCCETIFKKIIRNHIAPEDEKNFYHQKILPTTGGLSQKLLENEIKKTIDHPEQSEYFFINNRGRKFVLMGPIAYQIKVECRKPFFDNDLIEFIYGLPPKLRLNHYIYNKMLLKFFQDLYKNIPWQKIGVPISTNHLVQKFYRYYAAGKPRINNLLQKIGLAAIFRNTSFVDYNNWMRDIPELRKYIYNTLLDKKTLARGYFNPNFIKQIIDDHMSKKKNSAELIGLLLTFELFNRIFISPE